MVLWLGREPGPIHSQCRATLHINSGVLSVWAEYFHVPSPVAVPLHTHTHAADQEIEGLNKVRTQKIHLILQPDLHVLEFQWSKFWLKS
jgi:hypothetical protein